jgi:hypothetical protein
MTPDFPSGVPSYRKPIVYLVQAVTTRLVKIGKTRRAYERFVSFNKLSPLPLALLGFKLGYTELENRMHDTFGMKRVHGEWHLFDEHDIVQLRGIGFHFFEDFAEVAARTLAMNPRGVRHYRPRSARYRQSYKPTREITPAERNRS